MYVIADKCYGHIWFYDEGTPWRWRLSIDAATKYKSHEEASDALGKLLGQFSSVNMRILTDHEIRLGKNMVK